MAFAFNLLYARPIDYEREQRISAQVALHGGRLDFRTEASGDVPVSVSNYTLILFAFDSYDAADAAANSVGVTFLL